jgi:hypothetical protein
LLKLAYSDIGTHLEHLPGTIVSVIARRRLLAHRIGQTLHLEPSYAAVLIPDSVSEMKLLEDAIATATDDNISLCASLDAGIEVILQGCWVANSASTTEGLFLTVLQPAIEQQVTNLWQIIGPNVVSCTWPTGQALSELGYEF